jgi:hypothetical protein
MLNSPNARAYYELRGSIGRFSTSSEAAFNLQFVLYLPVEGIQGTL